MSLPLADLEALRDDLLRAQGSGAAMVVVNGKRVEYRTPAELREALADIERRIETASGQSRVSTISVTYGKGV